MSRSTTLVMTFGMGLMMPIYAQYAPPDPSGFEGIIVETYYVSDSSDAGDINGSSELDPGEVTYRLFVDLKPGYKLLTVGGFVDHPITVSTTTSLFNNNDWGEMWGRNIPNTHIDENTVAIDSWLSMGAACNTRWGVLKADDPDGSVVGGANNDGGSNAVPGGLLVNDVPAMGIPLTTADGLWNPTAPPNITAVGTAPDMFDPGGSSAYSEEDFAWAVLGGTTGPDTVENRILVGQFTTDGVLNVCLNLWIKIPDSLVCSDPNCHDILKFYATLLPSDTAGSAFDGDNKFTDPTLCFDSSTLLVDCEGVPGGPAQPGTACDDANPDTQNDVYDTACDCVGEDCLGVLGGNALPGQPCDDNDPGTVDDTWLAGCSCVGTPVGIGESIAQIVLVTVHPNPTRDLVRVKITLTRGARVSYELRDALGVRISDRDLGELAREWQGWVDMSSLHAGVYFLQVSIDGSTHVERITHF